MCKHNDFSFEKLKRCHFAYLNRLKHYDEDYPLFNSNTCTEKCKEKMKKITRFTFSMEEKLISNYFDDCKMVPDNIRCSISEYYWCLNRNTLTPNSKYMNIGFVDGKVVRLCDNSNDFTPEKIEEALNQLIKEEN
ncbi:hypothetical protein DICPUDRAFT_91414 [Dictyostelium purpureum]|uniref:Uncharacterized protein n=1 Tax=Dictyostelium purpureum TaxID=5786 RepID=F0ZC16_DICPU|nr:uncharacterized protein DICPUDRAFT_91414 [Dictyostelium purpureum]EGC38490.1 hypothetical protein DICPUDRAFT_91414 [Dictyostelium purpureum]|eukprot:XP_003284955.1 hypothetical protein DICPUDRAFT_91414 [Dictyostelium purpureum]